VTLDVLVGAAVSTPFALFALAVGRISRAGAVAGIVCAAIIYAAFYLAGLAVLGVGLVLTIAASRVSHTTRQPDALAEDDQRGAANIIANCIVGTLGAIAELLHLGFATELAALWCITGIAAGASDTVASEIGKALGGRPRAFPTWRVVAPGTAGAVSLVGTLAGITAAVMIAAPANALWLLPWPFLMPVVVGCTFGAFVESALATAFKADTPATNHLLNGINTAVAAICAVLIAFYGPA
jgi:uncharacterized protein (TIGR00297 family)